MDPMLKRENILVLPPNSSVSILVITRPRPMP